MRQKKSAAARRPAIFPDIRFLRLAARILNAPLPKIICSRYIYVYRGALIPLSVYESLDIVRIDAFVKRHIDAVGQYTGAFLNNAVYLLVRNDIAVSRFPHGVLVRVFYPRLLHGIESEGRGVDYGRDAERYYGNGKIRAVDPYAVSAQSGAGRDASVAYLNG